MRSRSPLTPLAALAAGPVLTIPIFAIPAAAQQFQEVPGLLPGPARWSEGVEAADVDRDGDLDLFFADGEGFASAGAQRQNVLLISRVVETGSLAFVDESVARLGTHLSNAKGVTTADVDGDGWVDALFANAFRTDPPFLYVNRGTAQPGFFDEQGAARGLTDLLSSAGAQFGDLDDDGDLDLVICDSGASFLGGAGGKLRFYRNDGTGHFTEDAAAIGAPTKKAQMDVQLVDVDGDWDLDVFGVCRATNAGGNHYLLVNDGAGNFSDASTALPPTSSNVYEAEAGDLDGDTDLDLFFVSLSGFQEGAMRNDGGLSFASTGALPGFVDDNEIALLDYDGDGDLDPFVGSLGATETIWRNDGAFSFTNQATQIQSISDSTLDITVADLDLDGAYDLVSAQGESNPAQWTNKVYRNNGPPDTKAPEVVAELAPPPFASYAPWVAKAKVRDAAIDDGVTYVVSEVRYAALPAAILAGMQITAGGAIQPPSTTIPAGAVMTWTNAGAATVELSGLTPPYLFSSGPIPPGGTYTRGFPYPGTYQVVATGGAAPATITVSAGGATASGLATGEFHRFEMQGALDADWLVYELYFRDAAGNETVTEPVVTDAPGPVGYCFGDGSGAPCPCGNTGDAARGCANGSSPGGALLWSLGLPSVASGSLLLAGSGVPPNQPGLFFEGRDRTAGGAGVPFGDGLRCAGGGVVRIEVAIASGSGNLFTSIDIAARTGAQPGDLLRYQLWYRDPAGSPCGSGFNLSNGVELLWLP